MTIDLWHYNIKLRLDKLATQNTVDLTPAEIDEFIRRGILAWLDDQSSDIGTESSESVNQKLSTLTVIDDSVTNVNTGQVKYEFDNNVFSNSFYKILRVTGSTTSNNCTKTIKFFQVQQDDLHYKLNDPLQGPSLKWGRGLYTIGRSTLGNKAIFAYTNNKFDFDQISVTYLKVPVFPTIGGYDDINQSAKTRTESDLPEETHDEVIDKVVELISVALNDPATPLYAQTYVGTQ